VIKDERLELIFTCCHPALPLDGQVALTLRALGGLETAEIARAFLVSEETMKRRLTRAKAKIKATAIPFAVPGEHLLADRLDAVLAVLYLIFNEGYSGRTDLAAEAIRLLIDWPQVAGLYRRLADLTGSAVVELNHAAALAQAGDPAEALRAVDQLDLDGYLYFHSTRGELLRRLGRADEARAAYRRALDLAASPPERRFLTRRLEELSPGR
jgi:predicted RNA polymerase sigma factor